MQVLGLAVDWEHANRAGQIAERLLPADVQGSLVVRSARDGIAAACVSSPDRSDALLAIDDLLIAFQGRLDDVEPLARNLGLDPSPSTAHTLARAYRRWGEGLVLHLRGDYAFVIWDGNRRQVLAARDPFGIRSLHYASLNGVLCLASDVDQLLASGMSNVDPDDQMVVEFLTRNFRTLDRSFFCGISRLQPGHRLIATPDGLRTSDYRTVPSRELKFSSVHECYEAFREKFSNAVQRRILGKAPVVIQLSGGLDSTSIVCVANALSGSPRSAPVLAASATFPGLDCDESHYLNIVEEHTNVPTFRWDGTLASDIQFSEPLLAAPGNRIPWASGTDGYVDIARSAGARAVMDGTGGDQIGMPLGTESDEMTRQDWRYFSRYAFEAGISIPRYIRSLRWAIGATLPRRFRQSYRQFRRRLRPVDAPDWISPTVAFRARVPEPMLPKGAFLSNEQRMRWGTLSAAPLAMSIEGKQRHASRVGLEMAFPFLDWDLVQFILAVPPRFWPAPHWLARFHREALRGDLPPAIYSRYSKAEFTSAMVNQVRRNLDVIEQLFDETTWRAERFIDRHRARDLLRRFRAATAPGFVATYHLWAIASVEAWLCRVSRYSSPRV